MHASRPNTQGGSPLFKARSVHTCVSHFVAVTEDSSEVEDTLVNWPPNKHARSTLLCKFFPSGEPVKEGVTSQTFHHRKKGTLADGESLGSASSQETSNKHKSSVCLSRGVPEGLKIPIFQRCYQDDAMRCPTQPHHSADELQAVYCLCTKQLGFQSKPPLT